MKFYAALLAVLMVGIAVGQEKLEPPCTYSGMQISGNYETNCTPAPKKSVGPKDAADLKKCLAAEACMHLTPKSRACWNKAVSLAEYGKCMSGKTVRQKSGGAKN